jgi:hypothetical protein
MSVTPEYYRAARLALPRLPLPAILGFAVAGFGGALFLAYTSFGGAELKHLAVSTNDVPVYEARAVPLDPQPEDIAQRTFSIAKALAATQIEAERSKTNEAGREGETISPTLFSDAPGELRGFSRFANFAAANSYLALTGATFGMSAQMSPSGFVGPDAESVVSAPVPEASTWLCGAALLILVAARGVYATWHRNQRRASNKIDSGRS